MMAAEPLMAKNIVGYGVEDGSSLFNACLFYSSSCIQLQNLKN